MTLSDTTVTVTLTEEQARRVAEAQKRGANFDYVLHDAIEAHLKKLEEEEEKKRQAAIAWLTARNEDVLTDPDEIRASEEDTRQLLRALNANRIEAGERPLYPEGKEPF